MSTKFYSGQKDYIPKLNEMDQAFQDAMSYLTGSTALPLALGTASAGVVSKYAREDHVHPSTGTTQAFGNNTTQYATTAFVQSALGSTLNKTVTTADVTLTAAEALYPIIYVTGALTGNRNLIVPASSRVWLIRNGTTGAFTLTVKTAAGTGIAVAQGTNRWLVCDGTNVITSGTDMSGISVNNMTGGTLTSAVTVSQTGTTPLTLTRTGSTVNSLAAYSTTSGTIYAGQGAANTYAIGNAVDLSTSPWFSVNSTTTNVAGNLIVGGNLTINGTTTTVNSTTVTVDDPIITLGGDSFPASDDGKDRGVEFMYYAAGAGKRGFYGYDGSTGKFIFLTDATNTSEVFTGTAGTIVANLEGSVTGNVTGNVSGTAANVTGTVAADHGGTGFASYTVGDILYAGTTTSLSKLAGVATGNVLVSGGVGAAPSYGKVGLTTHVSGTLATGNGGTGTNIAPTQGGIIYASTTSAYASTTAGTAGQVLTSGGASAPTWTTATDANTASAIVKRDANGDFSARNISVTGLSASGVAYLNGASAYTGYASGLTVNYTGIGTQYGITMKPASSTADTSALVFLTSGSTTASATTLATIQHMSGDAGMNLTGTWKLNGTAIATTASNITGTAAGLSATLVVGNGGTGLTSYAVGDILYASGASTLAKLADVATGSVLISGGVGVAPSYGKVGLTTHVSGTLAVGNGGTGLTATTQGGIVYGSSAAGYAMSTAGTSGQVLTSAGTAAPTWTTATSANTANAIVQRDASGNFTAGTATLSNLVSGNAALRGGGTGAEGAQIILGYGNNLATTVTGQANNTWNIDVDANNNLRIFNQRSTGAINIPVTIDEATASITFGGTGAVVIPVGTNANRPTAAQGQIRYNTDLSSFEGYNGTAWGSIGGGATGGGSDKVFVENDNTVANNYTITSGKNAMSAGPITINTGVVVTVPSGSVWTIV